jgi:XTP/dITP diphosphohydrolase
LKQPILLFASTNRGKIRELTALLEGAGWDLTTPDVLGLDLDVEENGQTYEENARLKATAFCQASGLPSLADDTGLEVGALDGAPGLHSARFSPKPNASDADRRQLLISHLREKPRPWLARFVCVVALATPDGRLESACGACDGEIIKKERGQEGFGYDRIFLFPELGKTMAELQMGEKNQISHRAMAVRAIIPYLKDLVR